MKELNSKKVFDLIRNINGLLEDVAGWYDTPLLKRVKKVGDAVITCNVVNVDQFKQLEAVRDVVHYVDIKKDTSLHNYINIDTSYDNTINAFFEILEELTINNYMQVLPALKMTLARQKVNELKKMILGGINND